MARKPKYRLTLLVEAASINSVESKLKAHFGEATVKSLKKVDLANSRPARLDEVARSVDDARTEVEELRQELEDWYDNLPDSFQQGDQGEGMQQAIDNLQNIHDELGAIDFSGVEFPGMRT